ncbi:Uu.00g061150.m01.CDS01 [Anthostomella pinea]|uniref:Uu.00g061150.m01.CDS01 n=1 Tax=Anthostomella pinea TaxID=933095 RepID=A0AAI8VSE5_9PEZI|nr:Uu.00g061150.m01.CDS01 [Anthostomella pinea]
MASLIFGALLAQGAAALQDSVSLPLSLAYGDGSSQVMTTFRMGHPEGEPLSVVADTGSANFWIFGPNATVNYGSQYLGVPGPCNETASPFYNYTASNAATAPEAFGPAEYAYGGNSKFIDSTFTVNDTVNAAFPDASESVVGVRVAVAESAMYRQYDDGSCAGLDHETGILGLAPFANTTTGPSFRQDLLDQGTVTSKVLSMWFEANEGAATAPLNGTALIGAVDHTKYSGELVELPLFSSPSSVGYFVGVPKVTINGGIVALENSTSDCLIDSGSIFDTLPFTNETEFLDATGLVDLQGFIAYPSACDDIPANATIDYLFDGAKDGESVTVKIPLRNYAKGSGDFLGETDKCGIQIQQGYDACTLAAPFFTGAFITADDEAGTFAVAQGGLRGSYSEEK